jgi:hypothetical protein
MAYSDAERQACAGQLAALIGERRLAVGDRLPGELVLAKTLRASRHLVRGGLQALARAGVIERRQKSGSYLLRPPTAFTAPAVPAMAPPAPDSTTVSLMVVSPYMPAMAEIQEDLLARGLMLHCYFAPDHASTPAAERVYLQQALASRFRAVLIHSTPLQPLNIDLFAAMTAAGIRLAHVGHFAPHLPDEAFFLPDLRLTGAVGGDWLLRQGCRRIRVVTSHAGTHHITVLLHEGVCTVMQMAGGDVDVSPLVVGHTGDDAIADVLACGPETGLLCYSYGVAVDLQQRFARRGTQAPVILGVAEDRAAVTTAPALLLPWGERVRDALAWALDTPGALRCKLYAPTFVPAAR